VRFFRPALSSCGVSCIHTKKKKIYQGIGFNGPVKTKLLLFCFFVGSQGDRSHPSHRLIRHERPRAGDVPRRDRDSRCLVRLPIGTNLLHLPGMHLYIHLFISIYIYIYIAPETFRGEIEIRDVWFAYPSALTFYICQVYMYIYIYIYMYIHVFIDN